jgi:hypothetical protein
MGKQKKLHYAKSNQQFFNKMICGAKVASKEFKTFNLETFAKSDRRCGNCERLLKKEYSWIGLNIPDEGFDRSQLDDNINCNSPLSLDFKDWRCAAISCRSCIFYKTNREACEAYLAYKEQQKPFNTTPADVRQNQEAGKVDVPVIDNPIMEIPQPPEITAQDVAGYLGVEVPEGYEIKRYGRPKKGDLFLKGGVSEALFNYWADRYFILRKIHKEPELVYCLQAGKSNWDDSSNFANCTTPLECLGNYNYRKEEFQLILCQSPEAKTVWLGHWNDGPKEG